MHGMSLFWRVFAINTGVLVVGALVVALSRPIPGALLALAISYRRGWRSATRQAREAARR
jgi:hypothetical protein